MLCFAGCFLAWYVVCVLIGVTRHGEGIQSAYLGDETFRLFLWYLPEISIVALVVSTGLGWIVASRCHARMDRYVHDRLSESLPNETLPDRRRE